MSRIRGRNTTPERYIAALLSASGLRFVQNDRSLPGSPDFVVADAKVAVFVDGDFWHGWRFPLWKHKLPSFWRKKISLNRERDLRNFRRLSRQGWKIVRIWEHQVEEDALRCLSRIARALRGERVDWDAIAAAYALLPRLKRRNRLPRP